MRDRKEDIAYRIHTAVGVFNFGGQAHDAQRGDEDVARYRIPAGDAARKNTKCAVIKPIQWKDMDQCRAHGHKCTVNIRKKQTFSA